MAGQSRGSHEPFRGSESSRMPGQSRTAEQGVAGVASTVKDKAGDLASNVAETAQEAWDSTRQGVQNAASAVASSAEDAFDSVTDFMRRYPGATFVAGFALGCLVAMAYENRYYLRSYR
jgi:hypothetical protein